MSADEPQVVTVAENITPIEVTPSVIATPKELTLSPQAAAAATAEAENAPKPPKPAAPQPGGTPAKPKEPAAKTASPLDNNMQGFLAIIVALFEALSGKPGALNALLANQQTAENPEDRAIRVQSENMRKAWKELSPEAEAAAFQKKTGWLDTRTNGNPLKADGLNADDENILKRILKNTLCAQKPGGGFYIFGANGNAVAMMDASGGVSVNPALNQPPGNPAYIDALLKGAVAYKSMNGSECNVWDQTHGMDALIEAKAYSLAGLKVTDKMDKTLDQVDPVMAKKMEDAWAKMKNDNQVQNKFDPALGTPTTQNPVAPPQPVVAQGSPPRAPTGSSPPLPPVNQWNIIATANQFDGHDPRQGSFGSTVDINGGGRGVLRDQVYNPTMALNASATIKGPVPIQPQSSVEQQPVYNNTAKFSVA